MQKIAILLTMAAVLSLTGCDSSDDSDSGADNGTPTMGTLDDVISREANSQPLDDGLDQVNADLLTLFGPANALPVALDDNETVSTFITKQRSAR